MREKTMTPEEFCKRYYQERKGTSCLKWDSLEERFGSDQLLPFWIADMDFKTTEKVQEALKNRIDHGVFGYTKVSEDFYDAVIQWEERHHGYRPSRESLRVVPGLVFAVYWAVQAFSQPKDAILLTTPVYFPFHHAITDNGRRLVTLDLDYKEGNFSYNPKTFEEIVAKEKPKMFILCSPHNPIGKVWSREELESMLDICQRHDVLVFSDEIHHDLTFFGHKHQATATINPGAHKNHLISAFAATKTFNLAACQTATVSIEDEELRKIWDNYVTTIHTYGGNLFGTTAITAALKEGEEWYQGMLGLIESNYLLLAQELKKCPQITLCPLEGTYLAFLDLTQAVSPEKLEQFIQQECQLAVDYGHWFGKNFHNFIRLNLATSPENIKEAARRLCHGLEKLSKNSSNIES